MPRPRCDFSSTSKKTYNLFCKTHPDVKVSYKEYVDTIREGNRQFMMKVIDEGSLIKLPWGFGELVIHKYKTRRYKEVSGYKIPIMTMDWYNSKRLGKQIRLLNYHTDGFTCRFNWNCRTARIKHSRLWKFFPNREEKRRLASILKSNQSYTYLQRFIEKRSYCG